MTNVNGCQRQRYAPDRAGRDAVPRFGLHPLRGLHRQLDLLEPRDIRRVRAKKKDKSGHAETWTVRYASGVPLSGDGDAPAVNWIELAVTDLAGKETFRNAWITDIGITAWGRHPSPPC